MDGVGAAHPGEHGPPNLAARLFLQRRHLCHKRTAGPGGKNQNKIKTPDPDPDPDC